MTWFGVIAALRAAAAGAGAGERAAVSVGFGGVAAGAGAVTAAVWVPAIRAATFFSIFSIFSAPRARAATTVCLTWERPEEPDDVMLADAVAAGLIASLSSSLSSFARPRNLAS